jgi:hypothetical protein
MLKGIKASQIKPRLIDPNQKTITDIFFGVLQRECLEEISDCYSGAETDLLLYHRKRKKFLIL